MHYRIRTTRTRPAISRPFRVAVAGAVLVGVGALSLLIDSPADASQHGGTGVEQADPVATAYLPLVAVSLHADSLPVVPTDARVATRRPTLTDAPSVTPSSTATPTSSPTSPSPECDAVPAFDDGLDPTREVHVAADGSDNGGDGSLDRPFASIRHAARQAQPGTAVRVHEGTYPGGTFVENLAGRRDAPIWIGGAPGEERPVLQGGGVGMHLVRTSYLVIHDLEVTGARNNGINADDGGDYADPLASHSLVFRDIDVHDIGGAGNQDCLKLSGVRSFVVDRSRFSACGGGYSGSGIDMVGCHNGVIARSSFEDHAGNAVQAKGGTTDIEIRWNRMVSAGQRAVNMGGSTGFEYFRPPLSADAPNAEARDVRVVANVIEGSVAPLAFVGCVDCLAANNTIIDPDRWLLRILQETTSRDGYTFLPASNSVVVNNLFQFNRGQLATYVNIGGNTAPDTFTFLNNLWYADDDPSRSQPDLPAAEIDGISGQDPRLGPGYSIDNTSPAARRGRSVAGVVGDITGRCYADPPSIGAYQAP